MGRNYTNTLRKETTTTWVNGRVFEFTQEDKESSNIFNSKTFKRMPLYEKGKESFIHKLIANLSKILVLTTIGVWVLSVLFIALKITHS